MCLSKLYFEKGKSRQLLMEEVASLAVQDGKVMLKTLFGERKEITASLKEIDFMSHTIVVEELKRA